MMNAPFDFSDSVMNPIKDQSLPQGPADRPSSCERFELLSAYMDGEVTAEERRLVESWLANEPKVKQMYQRLLGLKHGFSAMPVPDSEPVESTIDKVFEKVERRSRFRVIVGGGVAAAAAVVATVIGLNSIGQAPAPQMAERSIEQTITPSATVGATEGLLISLDTPVFPITKTAAGGAKTATTEPIDR